MGQRTPVGALSESLDRGCIVSSMTALDEFTALTHAIGEYSVEALGKESLTGLQVLTNPRELSAFITIALEDQSNAEQRRAIAVMFEVEEMYSDEIALTYVFVDHIGETVNATSSIPLYSYA